MQWALWVESEIFERRRYTIVQARRVCNGFQTKTKGFLVQLFLPQGFLPLSKSNIFFWHGSSPPPATKLRPSLRQLAALLEQSPRRLVPRRGKAAPRSAVDGHRNVSVTASRVGAPQPPRLRQNPADIVAQMRGHDLVG